MIDRKVKCRLAIKLNSNSLDYLELVDAAVSSAAEAMC